LALPGRSWSGNSQRCNLRRLLSRCGDPARLGPPAIAAASWQSSDGWLSRSAAVVLVRLLGGQIQPGVPVTDSIRVLLQAASPRGLNAQAVEIE